MLSILLFPTNATANNFVHNHKYGGNSGDNVNFGESVRNICVKVYV